MKKIFCVLALFLAYAPMAYAENAITAEQTVAMRVAQEVLELDDQLDAAIQTALFPSLEDGMLPIAGFQPEWETLCVKGSYKGDQLSAIHSLVVKNSFGVIPGDVFDDKLKAMKVKSCVLSLTHTNNSLAKTTVDVVRASNKSKAVYLKQAGAFEQATKKYANLQLNVPQGHEDGELLMGVVRKQQENLKTYSAFLKKEAENAR